jgi:phytoene desaturase
MKQHYDAIVIGAGAGGLFTAALLANKGYKTLIVEGSDIIGGRASTRYIDGFAINTGAMGIEFNTETERVFRTVGAHLNLRQPSPGIVIRANGRNINISTGPLGFLTRLGTHGLRLAIKCLPFIAPKAGESTHSWVQRFSQNKIVLGTVRNFCGSIFAAAPEDLPADLFLDYVTTKGAFKKFGFPPGGTINVWSSLIEAFLAKGGELSLNTRATAVHFDEHGRSTGIYIEKDAIKSEITANVIISDIGPVATLDLCKEASWPQHYTDLVRENCQPSAIITVYFASKKPLANFPGFACFSTTQRLCYATNFTDVSPENAPVGWHLYCGASVPQPATGDFDEEIETQLLMEDLRNELPGFTNAKLLDVVVTRDSWPAQRAVAGRDVPFTTPSPNLWNVGDAVKQWGNAATSACAETALLVAADIESKSPISNTASENIRLIETILAS